MRFALVNNERVEATPKKQGLCPVCRATVISKCGSHKVWHWAHKNKRVCDKWWEPETAWHRKWKSLFPAEWQEIVLRDTNSGEKHIADIRTRHGLVIEFQHSHINALERVARERFYQNMVWVVDGSRLKRDYPRFLKGLNGFRRTKTQGYYILQFPDESFPKNWLESSVPVIFDFKGFEDTEEENWVKNGLWCLLPKRADNNAVVVAFSHDNFTQVSSDRAQLLPYSEIVQAFDKNIKQQKANASLRNKRVEMEMARRRALRSRRKKYSRF